MTDLQIIELSMLKRIDKILTENNIPYWLAYGTVLGAIRHKGFIPWDDDIDIYIEGKDYERLREVFAKQDTGSLRFHDYQTVKGYPYVFPKVVESNTVLQEKEFEHLQYVGGVYIDIFPVYGIEDSKVSRFIDRKAIYYHYGLVTAYYRKYQERGWRKYCSRLAKSFNVEKAQEWLFKRYTKDKDNTELVKVPSLEETKRKYFEDTVMVEFEGCKFPVFKEYSAYLTETYGDYMKFPPKEQQIAGHSFSLLKLGDMN